MPPRFKTYDDVPYLYDYEAVFNRLKNHKIEDRIATYRDLCKKDLFFLLYFGLQKHFLQKDKRTADWVVRRCRQIQADNKNTIDLWAREHYKSTLITIGLTIQDILINPETTIGIFSHTRPIAKDFLSEIRSELEGDLITAWFQDVLYKNPRKDSERWSLNDGIMVKRKSNRKEATIEAWGLVDGMPTGKHFDVRVYDDVVTEKSVTTPEMIQKSMRAFQLSDNLGVRDTGFARIIGTIYHWHDPHVMMRDSGLYKVRVHTLYGGTSTSGVPALLTPEQVEEKKAKQGLYIFSCQQLLQPVREEDQVFRLEWMRRYTYAVPTNNYILVDPAGTPKNKLEGHDYTVIAVVGVAPGDVLYLLDLWRGRVGIEKIYSELVQRVRRWSPKYVGYERYGMQRDIEYIKMKMSQERVMFDIVEVGGTSLSKQDRIKRLVPYFSDGRFLLPEKPIWVWDETGANRYNIVDALINDDLMEFPYAQYDDMSDAIARICEREALDVIVPFMSGTSPEAGGLPFSMDEFREAFAVNDEVLM